MLVRRSADTQATGNRTRVVDGAEVAGHSVCMVGFDTAVALGLIRWYERRHSVSLYRHGSEMVLMRDGKDTVLLFCAGDRCLRKYLFARRTMAAVLV